MRLLDRMRDVGEFFSFSPRVARALGGPEEGLFFLFLFWRQRDEFDEVCVSAEEVEEATALTRRRQERIRKNLRDSGVLIEDYRGLPARLYYRIDHDRFEDVWGEWAHSHRGSTNRATLHVENVEQRFDDSLRSGPTKSRTIPLSEERSRTTTKNGVGGERGDQEPPRLPAQITIDGSTDTIAATKAAKLRSDSDQAARRLESLWCSLWGKGEQREGKARDDRVKAIRKAIKEHGEETASKLLTGHSRSDFHRSNGRSHPSYAFRPTNADRFLDLAANAAGATIAGSGGHGGGRGFDRAHGGSGEAVGTEVVLAQVRERERLEAIEREKNRVTPEQHRADLEYADQLLKQARKASKAGER